MREILGYTVPTLTSFHEDGSIDEEAKRPRRRVPTG